MKEKINKLKYGIIIFIVASIISIPLLKKNFNYYNDDGIQHIARAYLTNIAIKSGESTKILPNLENNFGYSWDLFYGPLSSFSIAAIGILFNDILKGYKIVLFLGLFFSGISMYFLTKKITSDKNVGLLSSILYMTMPYHLTDMYIRGSVGEFLSFIFLPIVFLGLYNLFNEKNGDCFLVIGAVGLLITHNLMALICAIIALIYIFANLPKLKIKEIRKKLFFDIVFILCISCFFWSPLLETSLSTKYEVYENGKMATIQSVQDSGIKLKQLAITYNDGNYPFEFGLHVWVMVCFTIAAFRRITPEMKKEYIFFLIIGIFSTFMSTKYFPWKILGENFSMIQYSWRMLEISNFCLSIICSINLGIVIKNFKFIDVIVLGSVAIIYVAALRGFIPTTNEQLRNVNDIDYGFTTGRNIDCLIGMGKNEYLPKNAYDNYFYLASREKGILVLDGDANISEFDKNGNNLKAKIQINEDNTLLELPYIYYPGYSVTLDGKSLSTFESKNGFLSIELGKISKSDLQVEYKGTNLMKISNFISIISCAFFIVYVITLIKKDKSIEI